MGKKLIQSGRCPVTKYQIENFSEWNIENDQCKNYIGVMNKNIILTSPEGFIDEKSAFETLHIFLNLIERDDNGKDKQWVAIHNWGKLQSLDNSARKVIFEDLFYNPKVMASIFYNLNDHLTFQLKLGKELRSPPCRVEIANNYEEAIWLSHKILGIESPQIITKENQVQVTDEILTQYKKSSQDTSTYLKDINTFLEGLKETNFFSEGMSLKFQPEDPFYPVEQVFSFIKMDIDYLRNGLNLAEQDILKYKAALLESQDLADNLKNQMFQADKMVSIGKMTSGIIHEINNPLTIIQGLTENALFKIKNKKFNTSQFEETLNKISNALTRILDMNRNIKKYIHPTQEPEDKKVDLHDVIYSFLSFAGSNYMKANIKITANLNAKNTEVVADQGKLHQILMNLIMNAKDALEETTNKEIMIGTSNHSDNLILTISDNGSGIPKNKLGEIFKTFYTSKAQGKGTGLGLSIVKGIIEDFGGSIKVESTIKKGTSFYCVLPLAKKKRPVNKDKTTDIPINQEESFKGLYLYMGNPDTPVLKMISKTLDQFGLIGDFISDPSEFHETKERKDFNLFLINMAEDEHHAKSYLKEFLKTKAEKNSNLVILIPAKRYDAFRKEFKIWGDAINGIIKMPFTQNQILSYLKNHFD